MKKGIVNLDEVVRSVIADEGRNTLHKYIWYLHYGLDFIREWNIDYHSSVITKRMRLDNNKGFCFPDDYVNFQSVGVKIGDRIFAFTEDNTLTSKTEESLPNNKFLNEFEDKIPYTNIAPYSFYNLKSDNEEDRNLDVYIAGATYPGYFTIDHKSNRVQFSAEVEGDFVYLEYVSNGLKDSEMSVVPEIAMDLAKTYIKWKYCRYKFGIESVRCKTWEQEYSRVRDRLLVRQSNLSYMSILNSFKRNFNQKIMN